MSQVSQPPFLTFTANTPFSPSSSFSRTTSADPKDNSQAESNYLPVLQYRKSCVRCDIQGLICVEDTNGDGIVARCQACRWANEKCKLDIDGRLVTVGKRGRSTYSKKCVYVDEQGQDIAEWPFKYVDDSPSVTDADDPAILAKDHSEWETVVGPWLVEVSEAGALAPLEMEDDWEMEEDQEMEDISEIDHEQSASTEDEIIHTRPRRNQFVVRDSDGESDDEVIQDTSAGQSQSNPIVIEDSENEV